LISSEESRLRDGGGGTLEGGEEKKVHPERTRRPRRSAVLENIVVT
jgi:hypothetical protein